MATFYLVRHGHNDLLGEKLAGRTPGVHLNQTGHEQAARLAQVLGDQPIKAVTASPLERTQETAQPIAAAHQLEVQRSDALLEIDFGDWTGQSFETLKEQVLWEQIQNRPSTVRFPNGESFAEAQARGVKEITRLSKAYLQEDRIVCVTHSDVIRLIVAHFLGMPLDTFQRLRVAPASISVLHLFEGKAFIESLNQTFKPQNQ
jgi:probable phosphoglycerate mutase